jgi:hypothetical protein
VLKFYPIIQFLLLEERDTEPTSVTYTHTSMCMYIFCTHWTITEESSPIKLTHWTVTEESSPIKLRDIKVE